MIALAVVTALLPLAGPAVLLLRAGPRTAGYAIAGGGVAALATALVVAVHVESSGAFSALSGFIYVDPLSAFFLITIAAVVALAGFGSAAYLDREQHAGALSRLQIRLYVTFFALFATMMLGSCVTGNLGLLWVLIEASTLASAVLVALEARATSLEAAWKYIIISSFGVTIALVGTLFLYYAATTLPLTPNQRLTWPTLHAHAGGLARDSLRLSFLLAVIGYGTKVGLAPMHTWLPDAHSEAPSPASAMLSAALLNTGMYAIIRFQSIAGADLGRYTNRVLLVFGFASIAVGALFMVGRDNFKRLFAYSSVEHMGIIAVALGFGGPLGIYGALLHTLNHAVAKAVLFLTGGELYSRYRTRNARDLGGVVSSAPLIGGILLLAALAITGSPPFGLFLSEFTIVRAGLAGSSAWLVALLLVLLVLAFVAFLATTARIALGTPTERVTMSPDAAATVSGAVPLVAGLAVLLVLGLWIPGGLSDLIRHSVGTIR